MRLIFMTKNNLRQLISNHLEEILEITPDELLLECLYNEIFSRKTVTNFVAISDEDLVTHYLAIEEFFRA